MNQLESGLTDVNFFQNPHEPLHNLRQEAPIYWSEGWGVWVLTRYDDVVSTLKNHKDFVNFGRVTHLIRQLPDMPQSTADAKKALLFHYETGLAHTDPPIHKRLRSLLSRSFTPRMVAHWSDRIDLVVDGLIKQLREKEQFDLLEDFAYPLPASIIGEMLGVPAEDVHLFQNWALAINQLFEKGGRMTAQSAENAHQNLLHMRAYIGEMVEQRKKNPTDDVVGNMVKIEQEGERLALDELVSTVVTFFIAGHDTTTNLISNCIYLLMQNRDAFAERSSVCISCTVLC
ncbi:MAG: cytochrome P450 [Chloroflexota bacterium]